MTADDPTICDIAGGHFLRLRAIALALRGPPLQLLKDFRPRERQQDIPCPAGNDQFFMNGVESDS